MIKTKMKALIVIVAIAAAGTTVGVLSAKFNNVHADNSPWGSVLLDVPFTTQAPLGEWNDPRQKDGCEEASILMAMMWSRGITLTPQEARQHIVGMSDFEKYFYGYFADSSALDTSKLMVEYFGYPHGEMTVHYGVSTEDIKSALHANHVLIVPINPRVISTKLYNSATLRHTVTVIGYDSATDEIIYHDPLLTNGAARRTKSSVFQAAMADYTSGKNTPIRVRPKSMIIVSQFLN